MENSQSWSWSRKVLALVLSSILCMQISLPGRSSTQQQHKLLINKVALKFCFSFADFHFLILLGTHFARFTCSPIKICDQQYVSTFVLFSRLNFTLLTTLGLLIPILFPHLVYTGFQSIFTLVSTDKYWETACKAIKRKSCIKIFYQSCQHHKSSRKPAVPSPAELIKARDVK